MNVELIGTGAIYSKYNSACTLIDDSMIVDVPNGALKQLLNSNHEIEKIDKILITHMHGDHTADIPFLLMYMYKAKQISRKTIIIGPTFIEDKIKQLFEAYNYHALNKIKEYIQFVELKPNEILEGKEIGYKIKSISVLHGNEAPAYGYIIDDKLGLTGDSSLCEGVEKIARNSKLVIADCSRINGDSSHMGIDNLEYLVKKHNSKIIATHLKDETREELLNLKLDKILVKEDGYKVIF